MNLDATLVDRYRQTLAPIPTRLSPRLDKRRPYQAILFDVYGTLMISAAGDIGVDGNAVPQDDQLRQLLRRYAIDFTPAGLKRALRSAIEASHTAFRQDGIDYPEVDILSIWQTVLGAHHTPWIANLALEYELLVNPVGAMPGADRLVAALNAAGITMGLISNAQFYTPFVLEGLLGRSLSQCGFDRDLLFYSWVAGHAKPSAVMFERARSALEKMAIPLPSVLYVGNDMRNDILPAASVGFETALFAGDQRSLRLREADRRCRTVAPDLVITDLRQLMACSEDRFPRG